MLCHVKIYYWIPRLKIWHDYPSMALEELGVIMIRIRVRPYTEMSVRYVIAVVGWGSSAKVVYHNWTKHFRHGPTDRLGCVLNSTYNL